MQTTITMRVVILKYINMLLNLIVKSTVLKICFVYTVLVRVPYMFMPEGMGIDGFLSDILSSIPSRVAGYLGVVYGLVIIAKKLSEGWKSHRQNIYDVKTARENYLQKKIETQKKQKELDDMKNENTTI